MESERRKALDIKKLIEGKFEVKLIEGYNLFHIKFYGPDDTAYKNGVWKLQVHLPSNYPRSPPAVNFMNRIFHPNIDSLFGTICLDLLNELWCAKYNLNNVFEHFLPSLLQQPNPIDTLNKKAGNLFINEEQKFLSKVDRYIELYATEEALSKFVEKEPTESDISDDDGLLEGCFEKSKTEGGAEDAEPVISEIIPASKAICNEVDEVLDKNISDVKSG